MSGELLAVVSVTLVTATFSSIVGRQWAVRHRPYQGAWLTALTMATIAGASYLLFLLLGRQPVFFRLYYLFGAALNVAFLGLGSLYLATRRSLPWLLPVLLLASVLTAVLIFQTPVNQREIVTATGAGTGVLVAGPWLVMLILLNSFGTVCLVGVAIYSAFITWRLRGPLERAQANVVIAVGALTIAAAGTLARFSGAGGFWVTMLVGWCIMFGGFLLTNRAARPASVPAPAGQPVQAR